MRRSAVVFLALLILGSTAIAQTSTGRLVGVVLGQDGSVIPGAAIVIIDDQTKKERSLTSSAEGSFSVPALDVGTYTVKITATGFKTFTATDVKIDIGREYSLNVTLQIGQVEDAVTVMAGADVVNSTNGELSNTVSPRQVLELPLNGRNPLSLVGLQPGAAPNRGNGSEIINGGRTSSTNFTRDGINVQDIFIRNGFVPDTPTVDNTGEFTVTTLNAGADQGYGSSQIQLVTPRGGELFHGAGWLYNRNSALAANRFFNNAAGRFTSTDAAVIQGRAKAGDERLARPFLNRNQFGGKVSGPIWFPEKYFGPLGTESRSRAFFFFSYEKFMLRQQTAKTTTIFRPDARNGIFSYRPTGTPGAGQCITFTNGVCTVNVLSGAGMTAAIPAASQGILPLDPIIQSRFLSQIPTVGNRADIGDTLNTIGFGFNQSDPEDRDEYTGRVDFNVNNKHSLNGVYRWNETIDARTDIDTTYNSTAQARTEGPTNFMSLGWNGTFGQIVNQARGGFQLANVVFLNSVLPAQPFLVGTGLVATNPEVNFRDQGRNTRTISFSDVASLVTGAHSIRFGGDANLFKVLSFNQAGVGIPTYNISTTANPSTPRLAAGLFPGGISLSDQNTADALRYLLGGVIGTGTLAANVTSKTSGFVPGAALDRRLKYETMSFFGADQWRVAPQFTLNYGLRWEYYKPLRTTDGLYLEPVLSDDAVGSILNTAGIYDFVGRNSGTSGEFVKADKNNFSPQFSFAWSPAFKNRFLGAAFGGDGRTVLRGGFRLSYVNDEYIRSIDNAVGQNAGLTATASALQGGSPSLNARPGNVLQVAPATAPAFITPPRTFADNNTAAFGRFGTVFAVDPHLPVQGVYEYNFGIQRELGFQTAIEIRYVGSRSNQLARTIDYNQIDIRSNGFGADFLRAVQNQRATGDIFGTPACITAGQCQPLTVINLLPAAGQTTVRNQVTLGTPADTALALVQAGQTGFVLGQPGGVRFLPNPNSGVINLVTSSGRLRYNALQAELRRRFVKDLYFQANYTFQKILTDVADDGISQARVAPFLDNQNPQLDYARASYDTTHIFNFNGIYELPFGRGKRFLNEGGLVNQLFGGWQLTSILQIASGAPLSIIDARGTLNRGGRSANQTANSSLTKDQIKDLLGVRRNSDGGLYYIDPAVIASTGRGANGFGSATFPGQVFFNVDPLQTGKLERLFINGPMFWNWDASAIKNFSITEGTRFQFRIEAFNLTNSTRFGAPTLDVNSVNFGKLTATSGPRIIQLVGRLEF